MRQAPDEVSSTIDFLASAGPYANTTVTNNEADEIMLRTGGSLLARGCLYDIKSQRVSPGVCKLTLYRPDFRVSAE
jgi:hypothetical protein